jgi:hypothetical protein
VRERIHEERGVLIPDESVHVYDMRILVPGLAGREQADRSGPGRIFGLVPIAPAMADAPMAMIRHQTLPVKRKPPGKKNDRAFGFGTGSIHCSGNAGKSATFGLGRFAGSP